MFFRKLPTIVEVARVHQDGLIQRTFRIPRTFQIFHFGIIPLKPENIEGAIKPPASHFIASVLARNGRKRPPYRIVTRHLSEKAAIPRRGFGHFIKGRAVVNRRGARGKYKVKTLFPTQFFQISRSPVQHPKTGIAHAGLCGIGTGALDHAGGDIAAFNIASQLRKVEGVPSRPTAHIKHGALPVNTCPFGNFGNKGLPIGA